MSGKLLNLSEPHLPPLYYKVIIQLKCQEYKCLLVTAGCTGNIRAEEIPITAIIVCYVITQMHWDSITTGCLPN